MWSWNWARRGQVTYPRWQKQGEAGLEKPDGLALGNPHLPSPLSSQLSAQAAKCMTHWPAEKLAVLLVSELPTWRAWALSHGGPEPRARAPRSRGTHGSWSWSSSAFIPVQIITKPRLGESPAPTPHPMCNGLCRPPPPLPGPSHSATSSRKPSGLPFQASEEQGANPPC